MIDVYYLIKKILDNAGIVMIPGFPLSAEICLDLGNDFPQQFLGKISEMVPGFFRNTSAAQLPLSPSQLALRPSQLPLSPSQLPLMTQIWNLALRRSRTPSVQCMHQRAVGNDDR